MDRYRGFRNVRGIAADDGGATRVRTFDEVVGEVRDEVHGHVDHGVVDIAGEVEETHRGRSDVRARVCDRRSAARFLSF